MKANLRLLAGILIGVVGELLVILAAIIYLPRNPAEVIALLMLLVGDAIAVLIANGSRKISVFAGMATGILYCVPVNITNYTTQAGMYSSSHPASFIVINIIYQVLFLGGVGAAMGLITYRFFIKKRTARGK